jgi:hypothetical protein
VYSTGRRTSQCPTHSEASAMAAVDDEFRVVVDGTLRGLSIATAVDLIGDDVEENFPLPYPQSLPVLPRRRAVGVVAARLRAWATD